MSSIKDIILATMDDNSPMNFDELYHATCERTGQNRSQFSKRMTALKAEGIVFRNTAQRFALTEEGEQALKKFSQKAKSKQGKSAAGKTPTAKAATAPVPNANSTEAATSITAENPPTPAKPDAIAELPAGPAAYPCSLTDIITLAQNNIDDLATNDVDMLELAHDLIRIRNAATQLRANNP